MSRLISVLLGTGVFLISCGGGGGRNKISVSLSPGSATVHVGGEFPFKAQVSGGSNNNVIWSLSNPNMGGVSPEGVFLAGVKSGQLTLIAQSVEDPSKSATATVTIPAPLDGEGLKLFSGAMIGPGHADGKGAVAILGGPQFVTFSDVGEAYFTDSETNCVRKISPDGNISTIAGMANSPVKFSDGCGTGARLNYPSGLAFGPDGDLLVVDARNHRIRKISKNGLVTTFAGDGESTIKDGKSADAAFGNPGAIVWNPITMLFYCTDTLCIRSIAPDGTVKTLSNALVNPQGICVLSNGDLVVLDVYDQSDSYDLKKIDSKENMSILEWPAPNGKPNLFGPTGFGISSDETIYICDSWNVYKRTVDGSTSQIQLLDEDGFPSQFVKLINIACDKNDNLYLVEFFKSAIFKKDSNNILHAIAGCGPWEKPVDGSAIEARFGHYDKSGLGYSGIGALKYLKNGYIYATDPAFNIVHRIDKNGNVVSISGFGMSDMPISVTAGEDGSIYVGCEYGTIYKIDANGGVNLFAGQFCSGTQKDGPRLDATFLSIKDLTVLNNVLYILDARCVRAISLSTGEVKTIAGSLNSTDNFPKDGTGNDAVMNCPVSMTIGSDGNIYFIDGNMIRKVTQVGLVTTISGDFESGYKDGPADQAKYWDPIQICCDRAGNLIILDTENCVVRKLDTTGQVSTIMGNKYFYGFEPIINLGYDLIGLSDECHGLTIDDDDMMYLSIQTGIAKGMLPK